MRQVGEETSPRQPFYPCVQVIRLVCSLEVLVLTQKEWKRRRIPKLLSPINSYEGAVRVVRAGADEVYCGVAMPEKLQHFTLYRGPGRSPAQLQSYDELAKVVDFAHGRNVKVVVTVNEPFMSEDLEKPMKSHVRSCLDQGADALIVGDLGVLSVIRDLGVDVPLLASTYFVSMNSEQVDFLRRLGFSRVILERHLTLQEVSEIVRRSEIPIEIFCHAGGCSNINANCYFYHYGPFSKLLGSELKVSKHVKSITSPCTLFYDIYDSSDRGKKLCNIPVLDAFTFCSLCHLQTLVQIGVAGLKIVGRLMHPEQQEAYTMVYREFLDMIAKGGGRVPANRLRQKIESLKRRLDELDLGKPIGETQKKSVLEKERPLRKKLEDVRYETLRGLIEFPFREVFCKQKRCYFSPLFNAPYEHFTSWNPREKKS